MKIPVGETMIYCLCVQKPREFDMDARRRTG